MGIFCWNVNVLKSTCKGQKEKIKPNRYLLKKSLNLGKTQMDGFKTDFASSINEITIELPEPDQFREIAKLHIEAIRKGFLSTLGVSVLKHIYEGIKASKHGGILVAVYQGKMIGFVSYTFDISKLYKDILIKKSFILSFMLFPLILRINILKKIFETLVYPLKISSKKKEIKTQKERPELLSIAVNSSFRGLGIGKKLIEQLNISMTLKLIKKYYTVTSFEDIQSNKFYESCAFKKNRVIFHHDNKMVEYIKSLH